MRGKVFLATTALRRLRGIRGVPDGGVVVLAPCRDVHTFGVARPIDAAFVDAEGVVVAAHRDVGPRRRIRCAGAVAVVERWSSQADPWFASGDRIVLGNAGSQAVAGDARKGAGR